MTLPPEVLKMLGDDATPEKATANMQDWADGHFECCDRPTDPHIAVNGWHYALAAAANTLRKLLKDGGEHLAAYFRTCGHRDGEAASGAAMARWLQSLGVEAKE